MKKKSNKKNKRVKRNRGIKRKIPKNKNLTKFIVLIIGLLIIGTIIYFTFINKTIEEEKTFSKETPVNILANFEWKEPKTITPYGGRFYDKCDDGKNLGKIWANIELQNTEANLSLTCKNEIIVRETDKIVDNSQLNFGLERTKSGFIGFTEELKKEHLIRICCKTKEGLNSFCKTFELKAYC